MERKLLMVFALTFLVIMLFQPLLKKYGPQPGPAKTESPLAAPVQNQVAASSASQPPGSTAAQPRRLHPRRSSGSLRHRCRRPAKRRR